MPAAAALAGPLLAVGLLAAACGGPAAGAAPDPVGDWELVELWAGSAPVPPPPGARATLQVADGAVGGTSYCNTYGGAYRLDGDLFVVEDLGGTEMGCAPEVMTAEATYLEALRTVERVGTGEGYLVLTGPGVEMRFRPVPPVPTSELTGTVWRLETLLDGEIASATTGAPAELVLAADGTLTGSTGCRSLSGRWAPSGDVVRVTGLTPGEGGCPPDVTAQDDQVLRVLEGAVRVAVAGDALTVTGSDGLGLVYRGS